MAVTTEFENVPAASLRALAASRVVSPPAAALEICQHRAREKVAFRAAGVPCAPFATVSSAADATLPALAELLPGILKTAAFGYDGKGQAAINGVDELPHAWSELGGATCVLERRLPLAYEVSAIVARDATGHMVQLPVQQNLHREGVLAVTQVPGPDVDAGIAELAISHARRMAEFLDYVGVLCVEFFVLRDGSLVANEMAPRPHNSGHYSIDACDISQFNLQVRTLAGLPLASPRQHSAAVMLNLLGDLWLTGNEGLPRTPNWTEVLGQPGVHLHLYGKAEARRGRKMGHLTITAETPELARVRARVAAAHLGLPPF
jgi:5-(carboxyamino)imidazole ribonucleotide synthase